MYDAARKIRDSAAMRQSGDGSSVAWDIRPDFIRIEHFSV